MTMRDRSRDVAPNRRGDCWSPARRIPVLGGASRLGTRDPYPPPDPPWVALEPLVELGD